MEQQTGSKLGKEYVKAVYCYPAYLTYTQSTSCEMPGWMKHKLESRLLGEISITSDTQMTPPYGRKQRGTKEPLGDRGEWKSWLKTQHSKNEDHDIWSYHFMANRWGNKVNIQKMKTMTSGPITSWQIDEETMETVKDFIFLGFKKSLQRLLKLMSIESVMPSNYLILCCPLLLVTSIFPSIRVFSSESPLCIR